MEKELVFIGANLYFKGNFKSKDEAIKRLMSAVDLIGLQIDAEESIELRDTNGNIVE